MTETNQVVEVQEGLRDNMAETNWVIEVQDKLGNMWETLSALDEHWKRRSIYKLHPCITNLNDRAFKPKVVSFGPYHHEDEHLKLMEKHKERALMQFLKRSKKTFQTLVDSLSQVVDELKNSYDPLGPEWREDTERFLKMMILDGCFMLEILHVATGKHNDYTANDPIFSKHGQLYVIPLFKRDMLMIENQLPILVLDILLAVEGDRAKDEESTKKLLLKFLCSCVSQSSKLGECLHVLDLYRKSLLLPKPSVESQHHHHQLLHLGTHISDDDIIHSATALVEAGIALRRSKTSSLRDVTFKWGVLRLPMLTVDDTTESTFLNLMAYERFHIGAGNDVTSYIFFMDSIIDTGHDVALLISKGIIRNAYGSNKAVAELFNSLSKDITTNPEGYMGVVQRRVNAYCKKPWNAWRANLIHTYFKNPWAILSVFAAVFLFGLTIGQTIYTVFPYYYPRGG